MVSLQAKMVPEKDQHTKLYLNGVETTERNYVADHTRFLLWIIPLPGGGGKVASNSKESEMVIEDRDFYTDLFDTVQGFLINNEKVTAGGKAAAMAR